MSKLKNAVDSVGFIFLSFMFIGSKVYGDAQDTAFWGVLLVIWYMRIMV